MRELTLNEIEMVSGAGFFSSSPGWGATIGGIIGGRGGAVGALIGTGVGHFIETRDYHKMGERYKDRVARDIKAGYLHND